MEVLPRPFAARTAGPRALPNGGRTEGRANGLAVAPRVLRVMTRLNVGGPARQALFLTGDLRERGFETRLVWGASGPSEGTLEPAADLPHSYMSWLTREISPAADLRAFRELSGLIRRWRPQIVHTHLAKAGALGRTAAYRAGVPVIVHTFHGHVLQEYFSNLKNTAFAAAERALATRTDALLAVSPWVREELLALGIGREEQWHVVPVGVHLGPLLRQRVDPGTARDRLGLPPDGPIVGCVGRLVPIKDHATFFEAAARVLDSRPDATFVLAGDGELRDRLHDRARTRFGDRVRFLGWVHDLPTLYGAFDVVALTSRLEGTPVALIEASAAGRPVVATEVGGVADVVDDGRTGHLVRVGDDAGVAASVLALIDDPARARAMGEAGAAHVGGRFSRERLADDMTSLYKELLARRSRVPSWRSPGTHSGSPEPSLASP